MRAARRKPPCEGGDAAIRQFSVLPICDQDIMHVFRGGYAMHQGYVPPFAASHGCIRLPQGMARTFYENAPVGTAVKVTE
jgi:hypothetical protein